MTDEPLLEIFEILARLHIPYMLTGSYASNLYGRIRSTFDADLVAALRPEAMKSLVEVLDAEYYLDSRSLQEARESGGQFNAVHKSSGLKIDFYLLGAEGYDQTAFARRRPQQLFGQTVSVIAPEDLILSKLRWAKKGGSGRQIEDAQGVYQLQQERLDLAYLRRWASELSVSSLLAQLES